MASICVSQRHDRPNSGSLFALLVALGLFASAQSDAQTPPVPNAPTFEDRLRVGLISWHTNDPLGAFVARLCGDRAADLDACFAKIDGVRRIRLATLYASPDASSAPVAYLHLATRRFTWGANIGVDVERIGASGHFVEWLLSTGDWFYGTYVDGQFRSHGDWIQLLGPAFPSEAWLPRRGQSFEMLVEDMTGGIFHLDSIRAVGADGAVATTAGGDYLITRIHEGVVEFRAEIATDFNCGEPVEAPRVLPPLLRAPAHEFFSSDGAPRFSTKYQKGC
jgi:hypothetical protein